MKVKVKLVKAFTRDKGQGNPAGVILSGDNLSNEHMRAIAEKLGFSESVFVQKTEQATVRTRFFTPKAEVDLCGHATIACFYSLVNEGHITFKDRTSTVSQETNIGILNVECHKNGFIEMEQAAPSWLGYKVQADEIASLLSIPSSDIVGPLHIISTGSPKLIVQVKSLKVLLSIKPNLEKIKEYCILSGARGFYPFTFDTIERQSDVHARQFNPLAGVDEDPITGVAAGALGVYLKENKLLSKNEIIVEQGYLLNKFGKMRVRIGQQVKVGGYAVEFGEEEFYI